MISNKKKKWFSKGKSGFFLKFLKKIYLCHFRKIMAIFRKLEHSFEKQKKIKWVPFFFSSSQFFSFISFNGLSCPKLWAVAKCWKMNFSSLQNMTWNTVMWHFTSYGSRDFSWHQPFFQEYLSQKYIMKWLWTTFELLVSCDLYHVTSDMRQMTGKYATWPADVPHDL